LNDAVNKKGQVDSGFRALREKAQQLLGKRDIDSDGSGDLDLMRLTNELEVQQVELELQNEELRRAGRELEASRNEFADLYQAAPIAFVTVDAKGSIRQVNQAAALVLAGSEDFLIGRYFPEVIHPDDMNLYFSFLDAFCLEGTSRYCELRIRSKMGRIIHVHLGAAIKKDHQGVLTHWHFGMIDITLRRQAEDALRKARDELEERVAERTAALARRTAELDQRNKQLARLSSELTLAEQRERRRLADLLHDHLQQMLAGARLNLEIVSQQNPPAQNSAFEEAYKLVSKSLETSRTLSMELSPPTLYMHGLPEAFRWLARWMEKTHQLQVDVRTDEQADPAQEEIKVLLFQSARELLFNVAKHSDTRDARLEARRSGDTITIVVSDKGCGFDPGNLWNNDRHADKSYGLFNIRERLLLLGGTFDIASHPDKGTTVTLSAPLRTATFAMPAPREDNLPQQPRPSDRPEPTVRPRPDEIIQVMLVDDHAVMRNGLSIALALQPDIRIVGEAADGGKAVELASQIDPDVILMDISMPVMDGIEATRIIHARKPHIKIIGLSMHDADVQAAAMREAGAVDFLSKSGSPSAIVTAIRRHCADW
jgi:PAS domain S-box-containing protein